MYRILVVEDSVDFYQNYLLRLFSKLLPMDKIVIEHVADLKTALPALREKWSMILMDHDMGPKIDFMGDTVLNGSSLVAFRRAVEEHQKEPNTFILGISSHRIGNQKMLDKGATEALLKLEVPHMAKVILEEMRKDG